MVKNASGGSKTKGLARKHIIKSNQPNKLRLPIEEGEEIACVTKMLGNGMCEIYNNKEMRLTGHIRGSMRGRQKRHNTITNSCLVLIGLRTWESTPKNCDILCIYDDSQIKELENIPNIKMDKIIDIRNNNMGITKKESNIIEFTEEEEEFKISEKDMVEEFTFENKNNIDIDDI
tara:strand:- start:7344 stop:7868 length:525 start_codon:yes stop_codon:yes gene_type:complete